MGTVFPLGGGRDSVYSFVVRAGAAALPATGFAPGQVTLLPQQPEALAYNDLGDLWLEIPRIGVQLPIVGVPAANGSWDVSWLGGSAGWLEGSAFPTWAGNSVLTGHVWNADNTQVRSATSTPCGGGTRSSSTPSGRSTSTRSAA